MLKDIYAAREVDQLEPYYSRHVYAMTAEELHSKSAIAAELAVRDKALAESKPQVPGGSKESDHARIKDFIEYHCDHLLHSAQKRALLSSLDRYMTGHPGYWEKGKNT